MANPVVDPFRPYEALSPIPPSTGFIIVSPRVYTAACYRCGWRQRTPTYPEADRALTAHADAVHSPPVQGAYPL